MADNSITAKEIESEATHRDDEMIESSVHFPMLSRDIPLTVYLDAGHQTVSPRQLASLNRLLSVDSSRLDEVKSQLFDRWSEYDHFYTDGESFEYTSRDEAYAASDVSALYLYDLGTEHADYPVLMFSVDWDPEHGANVRYHNDKFEWCL